MTLERKIACTVSQLEYSTVGKLSSYRRFPSSSSLAQPPTPGQHSATERQQYQATLNPHSVPFFRQNKLNPLYNPTRKHEKAKFYHYSTMDKNEPKCIYTCLNEVVSAPLYRFSSVLKSLVDRQQDAARNTNSPVTSQHDLMRYVTQTRIGHVTETVRGCLSVSQSGACVYLQTAAKDKCLMNYKKITRSFF